MRLHSYLIASGIWLSAGCSTGASDAPSRNPTSNGSGTPPAATGPIIGVPGNTAPWTPPPDPGDLVVPTCTSACSDFPAEPVIPTNLLTPVPANPASLFGSDVNSFDSGLCVAEPQLGDESGAVPGALMPANWLRPRFRMLASGGANLYEIRLTHPRQANALVAYTTATTWEIPQEVWAAAAPNMTDEPVTVTIRAVNSASPGKPMGARGTFSIAPVRAAGSLVYWATTSSDVAPTTSKLAGFTVGEDNVVDALTITQAKQDNIKHENGRDLRGTYSEPKGVEPGHVQCIGCHTSTPDGKAVGFTDHWPWNNVLASIEQATVGDVPSYVSPAAQAYLNQPWLGSMAFSPAFWSDAKKMAIVSYAKRTGGAFSDSPQNRQPMTLAWFDLGAPGTVTWTAGVDASRTTLNQFIADGEGTGWGLLDLVGETRSVAMPRWSHSGTQIAYTSATNTRDGRLDGNQQEVDIHLVPYNGGAGGTVTAVAGASEPGVAEFYPDFSRDDRWIAFNRVATIDSAEMYYRKDGEIYVTPTAGGAATRLMANDPPACVGGTSPGLTNSWARWSPREAPGNGLTYYWLVFSSARAYNGQFSLAPTSLPSAQLYMTAVTVDESGAVKTYPAVYIWNQDPATSNLTPAWDDFKIPPAPPRPPPVQVF